MASLTIVNVTKVFPAINASGQPVRALDGISLDMSGHQFVSLVGPSGSGKSTLLNIVSGVDNPTSGTVSLKQDGKAAKIGYVFQDARLLPWRTVLDNMLYVTNDDSDAEKDKAQTFLEMVNLGHTHEMYPNQLSGGMQQRVGIARAFFVDPDLLLMDEPFSHLDAITARGLRDQLQQIWNATKKLVLFVTHDVREAVELSSRVVILGHAGKIYDDFDIDLPYPRKASDPKVAMLQANILGRFEAMEAELKERVA